MMSGLIAIYADDDDVMPNYGCRLRGSFFCGAQSLCELRSCWKMFAPETNAASALAEGRVRGL